MVKKLTGKAGEDLVRAAVDGWKSHMVFVEWMRRLFVSLDKLDDHDRFRLVGSGLQCQSRTTAGIRMYKADVFGANSRTWVAEVATLVDGERDGRPMDRSLLKSVSDVFILMGVVDQPAQPELEDMAAVRNLAAVRPMV